MEEGDPCRHRRIVSFRFMGVYKMGNGEFGGGPCRRSGRCAVPHGACAQRSSDALFRGRPSREEFRAKRYRQIT